MDDNWRIAMTQVHEAVPGLTHTLGQVVLILKPVPWFKKCPFCLVKASGSSFEPTNFGQATNLAAWRLSSISFCFSASIIPQCSAEPDKNEPLSSMCYLWYMVISSANCKVNKGYHCSLTCGYSFLVGGFNPSEKYEFVSWDDDIPNWMESLKSIYKSHVPNHQPVIHSEWNKSVGTSLIFFCTWSQASPHEKKSGRKLSLPTSSQNLHSDVNHHPSSSQMDPNSFFKLPLGIENLHFFQWKSMEKPYTFQDSPLRAGKIGNFYTEPVIEQRFRTWRPSFPDFFRGCCSLCFGNASHVWSQSSLW